MSVVQCDLCVQPMIGPARYVCEICQEVERRRHHQVHLARVNLQRAVDLLERLSEPCSAFVHIQTAHKLLKDWP